MADDAEVRLGADTSGLKSGADDAASSVAASLAKIADALQNFGAKSKSTTEAAVKNNADLSRSFIELKASVTEGFEGVVGVVERFRGVLGTLTAALAGGLLWKESVSEMLKLEDAVRGLVIVFGMTTEEATKTSIALQLAGISAATYEQMGQRVGRVLRTQSEEFDRLGVTTKDATGNLLPMDQILQNVYARMQDFKAGTDQNLVALSLVGRNAVDFASDMERLNAVTDRAAQLQQQLGIEMGQERIGQIEAYRTEVNAFKIVLGDVADKIGEAVLPQLMSLAAYFNNVGPSAAQTFVGWLKNILAGLDVMVTGAKEDGVAIAGWAENIVTAVSGMARAFVAIVGGAWTQAADIIADTNKKILRNQLETNAQILGMEADLQRRMALMQTSATGTSGAYDPRLDPSKPKNLHFTDKPKGGGGDDRLAIMKENLDKMKEAEGYFHEFSKAQEAAYWEQMLAAVKGAGDKEVALRRDINKLIFADRQAAANEGLAAYLAQMQREIDAAKNNQSQQLALAAQRTAVIGALFKNEGVLYEQTLDKEIKLKQEWQAKDEALTKDAVKFRMDFATQEVAGEQQNLDQQVALRQVSNQQKFALEEQFENQLFELKKSELEFEKAQLTEGTLAYQQANEKILLLELQHQQKLTSISNQAELDRKQYALEAQQEVESSFASFFASVASGTSSVKKAFQDLLTSITNGLAKIAANQFAEQLFGKGTEGGNALGGIFNKIFGGGSSSANTGQAATQVAALGTAASTTAATSFPALDLAISNCQLALQQFQASLTTAGGSGGGGLGGLFSDTGGGGGGAGFADLAAYDVGTPYVPNDTIAMVHKGEAIIPAAYNRGGARSGSSYNMGGMVFNINGPIDARSRSQIAAAAYDGTRKGAGKNK